MITQKAYMVSEVSEPNIAKKKRKMANQNMQYIQGPKRTGLKMQAYTRDSKTGERRLNS